MTDCLFCKIINKEIPSNIVYEDENTIAFLDIAPVNEGHTLVIPKNHSTNVFDIDEEDFKHLAVTVRKIAHAVKSATNAEGVNIGMNNEEAAGQVIFHPHVHVIPRFSGDGLPTWDRHKNPKTDLAEIAQKIKSEIAL